jgi:hypothetical protein
MLTHGSRLLQQLVDQRGFAMIYVGDDGDISEVLYHGGFQLAKRAQVTPFADFKQCFNEKTVR